MRRTIAAIAAVVALGLGAPLAAQGNSGNAGKPDRPEARRPEARGQGQDRARGQDRATPPGQARAREARGNQGRGQGVSGPRRGKPAPDLETYNRNLLSRAAEARGRRHADARRVVVRREADGVRVVREDGTLLFALDRENADRLGYWRMGVAPRWSAEARPDRDDDDRVGLFDRVRDDERETAGSPSFCRSGAGHPVWGREWCVDKGFGLGEDGRWGRATDLEDIVLRAPRTERDVLDRGGLVEILGDIVFGRLAVQSLVLGADEPLTGRWIGRDDGPRILRVTAGDLAVAELVDADRDDDVDVLLVNLGG